MNRKKKYYVETTIRSSRIFLEKSIDYYIDKCFEKEKKDDENNV